MFGFWFRRATLLTAAILSASAGGLALSRTSLNVVVSPSALSNPLRESVLHNFGDTAADGFNPRAGLIQDASGALYGTASAGGARGDGMVFKLMPPRVGRDYWQETVLHAFSGPDGADPEAALIADTRGALYGTTGSGGSCPGFALGCGTVFKLTPPAEAKAAWTVTVLHTFTGSDDGAFPYAGLLADANGALYGTTYAGGGCAAYRNGCGTVFKLTPPASGKTTWTESVIHRFTNADGSNPLGGLIADRRGALYGTTSQGGNCVRCEGTVFKLTPTPAQNVWAETVLHVFTGGDGGLPSAGVVLDAHGALYGTTLNRGGSSGSAYGSVFRLIPPVRDGSAWTEAALHLFTSCADGDYPLGGVIFDAHGALFGTTYDCGSSAFGTSFGTVFELTPPERNGGAWTESVLHVFTDGSGRNYVDGAMPAAGLIADERGVLYGTTSVGGAHGRGTVYKLQR